MSEADVIAATDRPVTASSLVADLRALGVSAGDVVMVHSSLSRLGWIAGGPQAVVEALLSTVGPTGTVVMPTQSGQLTDPANWANPPVPADWIDAIRAGVTAFDPALTPTRGMGQVVECFRCHPDTRRSTHPTLSFAANGPAAERIVGRHPLTPALGDGSPLDELYDLDATILLVGVGHDTNTALHLAEHRASWPGKANEHNGAPMIVEGVRRWITYEDLALDTDDFAAIGEAFAETGQERRGPIGIGEARVCSMPAVVDFAVEWMETHRGAG